MTCKKVLIIGESSMLRRSLEEQLQLHKEFVAIGISSIKTCPKIIKENCIDIIICDDQLTEITVCEAFKFLRRMSSSLPIIMLFDSTVSGSLLEKLNGRLDVCIRKPFKLSFLIEKIRKCLRQSIVDTEIKIGPYTFMLESSFLENKSNKKRIHLTEKEAAILRYLHRSSGNTVNREVLLGEVWGYRSNVTTHTIETHVYRLRQKIEENPSCAKILVTEAGGYRLII